VGLGEDQLGLLLKPIEEGALRLAAQGLMSLTSSEYRVLRALLHGMKPDEIAAETGLTKLTVQFYLKTIFRKCACDRLTLMKMASRLELNEGVIRHLQALQVESEGHHRAKDQSADVAGDYVPLQVSIPASRFFDSKRRPFKPRRSLR